MLLLKAFALQENISFLQMSSMSVLAANEDTLDVPTVDATLNKLSKILNARVMEVNLMVMFGSQLHLRVPSQLTIMKTPQVNLTAF